jgi:hypothetical protein
MSLIQRFISLPTPERADSYSAEPDTGHRYRAARSSEGHPAVLISFTRETGTSNHRTLATIQYRPPATVQVLAVDQDRQARLAILECRTVDADLAAYFFRIVESVLIADDRTADEAHFEASLDAIVTLFRALQRPARRSVQGLWAELAIIAWSARPEVALTSWHSDPHALHDFASGSFRLELKSTIKTLREHTFLLDQLSSMSPGVTLIGSLMLVEDVDGANLSDLLDAIRGRLSPGADLVARLEVVVAESLGQSWHDARDVRFEVEAARKSLRLYAAEKIPTVPQPLPSEVKDVRFVADLSTTPWIELPQARSLSDLFNHLLPR